MRTMKFKKFVESNLFDMGIELNIDSLTSVSDEYYKMDLTNIDVRRNELILDVVFYEVANPSMKGSGKFKYTNSEIESLKGDITPINITGILQDVYEDDMEAVLEFIYRLVDEVNNKKD